jgi:hypothetical protein
VSTIGIRKDVSGGSGARGSLRRLCLLVVALLGVALRASAQQGAPTIEPSPAEQQKPSGEQQSGSTDRLFWTLPNFLTVENADIAPPLTTRQKYNIVTRSAFDFVEYGWYGFLAGLDQTENSEPGYGPGAGGYVKRYASEFADGTIENFMVGAVLPSLFHQDPRYYQLGRGSVWHRAGYAAGRILVTRNDSGARRFNASEILGSAATAIVSNAYHPSGDRGLANTMTTWWSQVAYDATTTVVKEFWPDIRRRFRRH